MAINSIANKYAKAAFNVAKGHNLIDRFSGDLQLFVDNFSNAFIKELSNPTISKEDLAKIITEIAGKLSLNDKVVSFLTIVAEARRIGLIKEINQSFSNLVKAEKKILEVEVFAVENLSTDNISEIKAILQKKYPGQTLEIKQIIKKDILGGVVIKVGSTMIDASLKTQLDALNNQFQSTL